MCISVFVAYVHRERERDRDSAKYIVERKGMRRQAGFALCSCMSYRVSKTPTPILIRTSAYAYTCMTTDACAHMHAFTCPLAYIQTIIKNT